MSTSKWTRVQPAREKIAELFNREVKAVQRGFSQSQQCWLHKVTAEQTQDRRSFIRKQCPVVLEVGASTPHYFKTLLERKNYNGLKQYIQTDVSEERLNKNYAEVKHLIPAGIEFVQICCDEEEPDDPFELPQHSVDMAISNCSMHWVNNLESAFVNIRRVMKPDAPFLLTMFGGNTLAELRSAFALSDQEVLGGVAPHTSPMIDGAGISELFLQAGFSLPSIDLDRHVLQYNSAFHLFEHLQAMGEQAVHSTKESYVSPVSFCAMASLYDSIYGTDGVIPATYEIFHAIAWSPHPDHPRPSVRGSASASFHQLNSEDHQEFNEVVQKLADDPDDSILMRRAEDLYRKMNNKKGEYLEESALKLAEGKFFENPENNTLNPHMAKHATPDPRKTNQEASAPPMGFAGSKSRREVPVTRSSGDQEDKKTKDK